MMMSPTLNHAIESLEHGIEHYIEDTPRSRKFALLHFDHSVELLLKEKLVLMGKSIYKSSGTTLNIHECFQSLERENIIIPERPRLEDLHEIRNTTQHRGFAPDEKLTEFYVIETYGFLKRFLKEEIGESTADLLPKRIRNAVGDTKLSLFDFFGIVDEKVEEFIDYAKKNAKSHPTQSIISSWMALELTLQDYESESKPLPIMRKVRAIAKELRIEKEIDWDRFDFVRKLRNEAIHVKKTHSPEDAVIALEFVKKFIDIVQKPQRNSLK